MSAPISALVDSSTSAILALSVHPSVVEYLAKGAGLDAEKVHGINWPTYRGRWFPLARASLAEYPYWVWDGKTRTVSAQRDHVTYELKLRSTLALGKCKALTEVSYEISVIRYQVSRGILMQDIIYQKKREQAQRRKGAYIEQYAEFADLTIEDAAAEILFKAELDDAILLKTEGIRLKYFNLIRNARTIDELERFLKAFREEAYRRPAV